MNQDHYVDNSGESENQEPHERKYETNSHYHIRNLERRDAGARGA